VFFFYNIFKIYVVSAGLSPSPDAMAALSLFLALSRYVSRAWRHHHSAAKPLLTVGADVGSVTEGVGLLRGQKDFCIF
jgi:hypothetical protein